MGDCSINGVGGKGFMQLIERNSQHWQLALNCCSRPDALTQRPKYDRPSIPLVHGLLIDLAMQVVMAQNLTVFGVDSLWMRVLWLP